MFPVLHILWWHISSLEWSPPLPHHSGIRTTWLQARAVDLSPAQGMKCPPSFYKKESLLYLSV